MALIDNLISYYKFDENTGTTAEDIHSTHDATFDGAGTHWDATGIINSAGLFSGTSGAVVTDHADFDVTGAISISGWTYMTTVNVNNVIASKRSGFNSTGIPFELTSTGNPDKFFSWRIKGSGDILTDTTIPIQANTWYHVVGTWDGTTQKLYINGVEEATRAASITITVNATDVNIGRLPGGGENTTGRLDEIGIWGRGLTGDEVAELYNAGAGLAYPFTSGTAVKDLIGGGIIPFPR